MRSFLEDAQTLVSEEMDAAIERQSKNSVESSELTDETIDHEWEKATKVDESEYTDREKLWQKFGKMFGLDVKIYTVGSRAINGMVHTGRNDLYLNRNSLADPKRTFWHEVFHILKANNYKLFTDLKDSLRVSDKTINEYRNSRADLKNEDNDFVLEEILADNMANSAERLNMFRKLSGLEDRSVIQRFVDYVKDMMDKFIELFHNPIGRLTTAQRNQMRAVLGKMAGSLVDANGNKIFKVSADGKRITAIDGEYNKQGEWINSATGYIGRDGNHYIDITTDGNRPVRSKKYYSPQDLKSAIAKWRIAQATYTGKPSELLGKDRTDKIDKILKEGTSVETFAKQMEIEIIKNANSFDGYTNFTGRDAEIADHGKIRNISILKASVDYAKEKVHDNSQWGLRTIRQSNQNVRGEEQRNSVATVQEPSRGISDTIINWLARKLNHGYDVDNPNASGIKKRELKPDRNQMYLL